MRVERGRGWAAGYLVVQAAAVSGWWLALATSAGARRRFELAASHRDVLTAFLVADLTVVVAGSVVAAAAVWNRRPWSGVALGAVAGGLWYATLYLISWLALTGRGGLGLPPMLAASVATSVIAVRFR
jgi:hypothetical protein